MPSQGTPLPQSTHQGYRADIDGLRAIAVLLVIAFHAYPGSFPGGFIGVDIFFVISGYLITGIIIEAFANHHFSLKEFYIRRIKRIFPALILVLVSCLTFGWFALLNDEYQELGKHVLGGAGFYSNLLLWSESGYFDSASNLKPLLHLWSLGIEEQFYLIWPLLVWLTWRTPKLFLALLIGLLLGSFALNIYLIKIDSVETFYSPITRFWELLLGGLLAASYQYKKLNEFDPKLIYRNLIASIGVLLIIFAASKLSKNASFPGWWALLPTIGAICIILAGPQTWINRFFFSNKVLVWIGLISFPLYLWHWPLIAFANIIEGDETHSYIRTRLVLIAIFLSWLTYRFIEKPIRLGKAKSAFFLAPVMLAIGVAGWHVYHEKGYPFRNYVNSSTLTPEARDQIGGRKWKYIKNDSCLSSYPLPGAEKYSWWFCMKQDERKPTVIILGNSFANQLYPGFAKNSLLKNQSFLSIGACPIGFENNNSSLDENNPCSGTRPSEQNKYINQLISSEGSFKYAILDGLERNPDPAYIARIKNRVDELESSNLTVIIFTPRAQLGFDPKLCYSTTFRKEVRDCSISPAQLKDIERQFQPLIDSISKSNPKTRFFDQNIAFCKTAGCSHIADGMPLSRDAGHMSEFGSINLQEYFYQWASKNIPEFIVR